MYGILEKTVVKDPNQSPPQFLLEYGHKFSRKNIGEFVSCFYCLKLNNINAFSTKIIYRVLESCRQIHILCWMERIC
jgi:hypothetical protein